MADNHTTPQPFEHYCHCGKWGAFGIGASLLKDKPGVWLCHEHWRAWKREQEKTTPENRGVQR